MLGRDIDAFIALLEDKRDSLYMLIDSARDRHQLVPWLRRTQGLDAKCLFSGLRAVALAGVAPYLAQLPQRNAAMSWVMHKYWGSGKCWSVIVESEANFEQTCLQLKKSLMVELDGKQAYFRFYDARAFEKFLSIGSILQMEHIFGDCIEQIYFAPAALSAAPLMAVRRVPQTGLRAMLQKNVYQMVAYHRQGERYVENNLESGHKALQ